MANIKIVNTLAADEMNIDNPGAKTGPYAGKGKFNAIAVPMPRTAMKIVVEAGEELSLDVTDYRDIAFFNDMKIPGLEVTVGEAEAPVEDEGTTEQSVDGEEDQNPTDPTTGEGDGEDETA